MKTESIGGASRLNLQNHQPRRTTFNTCLHEKKNRKTTTDPCKQTQKWRTRPTKWHKRRSKISIIPKKKEQSTDSGGRVTPPIRLQFLLSSASHFKSKFQEVQSTSSNDFRFHATLNFNHPIPLTSLNIRTFRLKIHFPVLSKLTIIIEDYS